MAVSINTPISILADLALSSLSTIIRANPPGVKSRGRQTCPNETLTMPAGHDYMDARDMVTLPSDPTTRTKGLALPEVCAVGYVTRGAT